MSCCCRTTAGTTPKLDPIFLPTRGRKCTDVLCCLLFLAFWAGMAAIAVIAFTQGDPSKLVQGTDYQGNTCGSGSRGSKVYFPRITEDLMVFATMDSRSLSDLTLFAVCVEACPSAGDVVCTANGTEALVTAKTLLSTSTNASTLAKCRETSSYLSADTQKRQACGIVRQNCWVAPLNSTEYFNRCVWRRQTSSVTVETCLAPEPLANKTRPQLEDLGEWEQCVTKSVVVTEVTVGEAQPNPVVNLMFHGVKHTCSLWEAAVQFESGLASSLQDPLDSVVGVMQHPSHDVVMFRQDAIKGPPLFDYHRLEHSAKRPTSGIKQLVVAAKEAMLSTQTVLVGNEPYTTTILECAEGELSKPPATFRDVISDGYTSVNRLFFMAFFAWYRLFRLKTASGHSALRIASFFFLYTLTFARACLLWTAPAILFIACHAVLYEWAGPGGHMHVFEALYGGLYLLQVALALFVQPHVNISGWPSLAVGVSQLSAFLFGAYGIFTVVLFSKLLHDGTASVWALGAVVFIAGSIVLGFLLRGLPMLLVTTAVQYLFYFPRCCCWCNGEREARGPRPTLVN